MELMVVVFIIGLLASIAIPTFIKYTRKAKSTETYINLRRIAEGARGYVTNLGVEKGTSAAVTAQFPASEPATPGASCCAFAAGKCQPDTAAWSTPTWNALAFYMEDPHLYRYQFISTGTGEGASFTARALGDLDCDGVEATYEMYGTWTGQDVTGSAGTFTSNQGE